ncbi:MAG: phosphoribosylformylglycinamidine synthase II [Bdellovibrionales bacterium RBG_16_40_8]|nr:MAG: phosphoribosylformylglycinamidine synthase II [Bdellovibrionales bacterium RBG_16_40_8]
MEIEQKLKHYRLSRSEYDQIVQQLGRPPEGVEWALYSALWSEHCSYKSSRIHLKKIFNKSSRVVAGFGENAGVIDLGLGERVAFKIESHNHPSFIEPYEGAATGVGGILRDIFTMGARPIALANYLCFGEVKAPRMTSLLDGVVRGIGGYGNCVGVPTITGQTEFHTSYNKNILVNALAVGYFAPEEPVLRARAEGVGNLVVYVGAKTGKDGVHGASMASESFDEKNEKKKPTIQKGDPFYEKLLIESCIEVMKKKLVVAIQDMGAAGLTSSSFEMAAQGKVGFCLNLDKIPLRDSSMTPEEILLSESQERMLMVVRPENLIKLKAVFAHWGLDAEAIGEVTAGPEVELFWHGENICKIDPRFLVDEAPRYDKPYTKWQDKNRVTSFKPYEYGIKAKSQKLLELLRDPKFVSRNWIYDQYDQRVGAKTVFDCTESVGAQRLPSGKILGLVLGGRPYVMRFDAYVGAIDCIAYPALELAAKGFLPLAATDCLNFGSPDNPEIMSEFVATIEGMSAQCEALHVPIISGNVSFYNETLGENITSTPATGLVGLKDHFEATPRSYFQNKNDEIYLLRLPLLKFQGMFAEVEKLSQEGSGYLDVKKVASFADLTRHLALVKGVSASRVVGKIGLAYALARMTTAELGVEIDKVINDGVFIENLYEVLFTVNSDSALQFRELFNKLSQNNEIDMKIIGHVREGIFKIKNEIDLPLSEIHSAYNTNWEVLFAGLS